MEAEESYSLNRKRFRYVEKLFGLALALLATLAVSAQVRVGEGQLSGSFESNSIYYQDDSGLGAAGTAPDDRFGSNNYMKLDYMNGRFLRDSRLTLISLHCRDMRSASSPEPITSISPRSISSGRITTIPCGWVIFSTSSAADLFSFVRRPSAGIQQFDRGCAGYLPLRRLRRGERYVRSSPALHRLCGFVGARCRSAHFIE